MSIGEVHYFVEKNSTWCEADLDGVSAWILCLWLEVRSDTESAAATASAQSSIYVIHSGQDEKLEEIRRREFYQCKSLSDGTKYVVDGENVSTVSLTYENDTGGTGQGDFSLPYCRASSNFSPGDFLYLSAQIIDGSGSIKCQIYDGQDIIAEADAHGYASIATCSGSSR